MKTIEEINKIAPYHPCEWQEGYGIWQAGFMEGQKSGATDTINKVKDICEKWQKVYLHKATSPSPYSKQIAPEQFNAVNNVFIEVLKEFGVYPEEEEED